MEAAAEDAEAHDERHRTAAENGNKGTEGRESKKGNKGKQPRDADDDRDPNPRSRQSKSESILHEGSTDQFSMLEAASRPGHHTTAAAVTSQVNESASDSVGHEEHYRTAGKELLDFWEAQEQQAKEDVLDRPPPPPYQPPSEQIHILGTDVVGRYIAHALAGCRTIPPVRYLIHRYNLWTAWEQAGRRLTRRRGAELDVRGRVVGEYCPKNKHFKTPLNYERIDNLIITVPPGSTVSALADIRHRLDYRSTICLVQTGLGVAEALIDEYFPNVETRPTFLLGHLTTAVGSTGQHFSFAEFQPGRLYLSIFEPSAGKGMKRIIKHHPPIERTQRATHLLKLLTAMPELNATGHPMADFFRQKLPSVAFRAVADPLAMMLDSAYNEVARNTYTRQLMDQFLGDITHVVARLPECRNQQKFAVFFQGNQLRKFVYKKLRLKDDADSPMRNDMGAGTHTDLDYLTGYFVRRARELSVPVPRLENLMLLVKAKKMAMISQRNDDIPLEDAEEEER
ncbi:ketopantoate reductase PanE/ApbA-domain-containing protein [Cercophora scortea]|uniref:Ketopantoate reductase PanE/ApbA-domain-containing protein n=1 Tax=Cercophora scortea TaxID=314031 RepID=A0AAE0J475_9PEZI|nr:ketopantoate reductase PanE/ApbA-domain-containing protein [Cercophora scortea]